MMVLVQYGRLGFLARAECGFEATRGDRVVLRTDRGLELGVVLCHLEAENLSPSEADAPRSEVLRRAALADLAAAEQNEAFGLDLLAAAERSGLPIAFVDSEVALDRSTAVLHALPWEACDASPVLAELSNRYGLAVRLLDLSRSPTVVDPPDPETQTCGKPDCGSGSGCSSCSTGGCSTGSCSKGAVKSAAELTAYFTDLRTRMHSRTPLV